MTALKQHGEGQPIPTQEFMVSLFDGYLRERMEGLPPELSEASQVELEKLRIPNETDYKLRERVWNLAENALKTGITSIMTVRVCEGICSTQNFHVLTNNPVRLAWLMHRPIEDKSRMETQLQMMLSKIEREVLTKPINDDNLGHFLKLLEFLTNRVHGPLIQKIQAQHAHMNLNKPLATHQDPNARLEELKQKLAPRDVTPEVKAE